MQLLFESSEEAAGVSGLGVVEGAVRKFPCRKIPQIGWNMTYPVNVPNQVGGCPPRSQAGGGVLDETGVPPALDYEGVLKASRKPPATPPLFPPVLTGAGGGEYFYYIHSFYCAPRRAEDAAATAHYYLPYCAAIQRGALAAVQFHPEKSGEAGLSLLRRWLDQATTPPVSVQATTPPASVLSTTPPSKSGGSGKAEGFEAGGSSVGVRLDFSSTLPSGVGGAPPHDADSTDNSLTKRIIPCLDVDDGRVVKGVRFAGLADAGCPEELARRYNDGGADELTFLDIGASYKSRLTLLDIVGKVAAKTFVPLCVGGGIRTVDDMRDAMNAGADKVSVCSAALKRPALLSEMAAAYGSQCVVLSIDAKRVPADGGPPRWNAFSRGGRDDTGIDAVSWAIEAVRLGAGEILLNSIDADGTGAGYDLALIRAVTAAVPVPVIASGGAGALEQIAEAAAAADAALVASLLHFGKTTIPDIKACRREGGVGVR
jgi:cyclase